MSDANLNKCASEHREGILDGRESTRFCFMICASLQGWLSFAHQVETDLIYGNIEGWAHCWLELENGRILDPTADQFPNIGGGESMPGVFLGNKPTWYDPTRIESTT